MIFNISYKNLVGSKPLRIIFDKKHGFIRIYDGTRYLILFGSKKYDGINDRVRYVMNIKMCIANIFTHCFAKVKVDTYEFFPIQKILNLHNL